MTKTEYLEEIYANLGGDVSTLPDRLLTTYLSAISEKLGVMKENGTLAEYLESFTGQYNQGVADGWRLFFKKYQDEGRKTDYTYGFAYWSDEAFYPVYDIVVSNLGNAFVGCKIGNLKERLRQCNVNFNTSNSTSFSWSFGNSAITHIPEIDTRNANGLSSTFNGAASLVTIDKFILKSDGSQTFANTFQGVYFLENIIIEGVIGQNGFNMQWSRFLTHDSLISIINALKDYSGTDTWMTITLGADNLAKLTAEEKDLMESKQWEYK